MKIQFEQPERHCLNTAAWGADGKQSKKMQETCWKLQAYFENKCKINVNKCK